MYTVPGLANMRATLRNNSQGKQFIQSSSYWVTASWQQVDHGGWERDRERDRDRRGLLGVGVAGGGWRGGGWRGGGGLLQHYQDPARNRTTESTSPCPWPGSGSSEERHPLGSQWTGCWQRKSPMHWHPPQSSQDLPHEAMYISRLYNKHNTMTMGHAGGLLQGREAQSQTLLPQSWIFFLLC